MTNLNLLKKINQLEKENKKMKNLIHNIKEEVDIFIEIADEAPSDGTLEAGIIDMINKAGF